jgi:DNA repair/transcription protein MET18/MMS19
MNKVCLRNATKFSIEIANVYIVAASESTSPLLQHKDRFFGIFESSLLASNEYNLLRLSGLTGLKLMISSKGCLESNEVGVAVQSITKILLDEQDEELR